MWTLVTPQSALLKLSGHGSRTIGNNVLHGRVPLPELTEVDNEQWSHHIAYAGMWDKGDVGNLGRESKLVQPWMEEAVEGWLSSQAVPSNRDPESVTPLACVGSGFHHDADSYANHMFCVLWLSHDLQWDLYFPFVDVRVPLHYGTVVLFDSAQPHGVVPRGACQFWPVDLEYETGIFVSKDIPITPALRARMGIQKCSSKGRKGVPMLNREGYREELDFNTASWHVKKMISY